MPASAGGPLIVTKNGTPYAWDTSRPVTFTPDQGKLGSLANADAVALTNELFQVWASVPTSTIRLEQAGELDTDVTAANVLDFLNTVPDTINPIIFDTDGSITDALIGPGARLFVLGFAGPARVQDDHIEQSLGVLNGLWIDGQQKPIANPEVPLARFRTVFVHEFGHFIGLDHSALNAQEALDGDATNDDVVPTMFPQLVSDKQATPHLDDIAALSTLYPTPEFVATTGVIRGRVLFPDGSQFQGADVIARNVDDPRRMAVSSVSGFLHTGSTRGSDFGSHDPPLLGFYELSGLPPGKYTVEISSINSSFRGGSSVGPLSPPVPLPGTPQYFVGPGQPGSNDPTAAVPIPVAAGSLTESVDMVVAGRILSVGNVQGRQGVLIEIPVSLSDPSNIGGLAFSLSFDPQILTPIDSVLVSRGPVIPSDFIVNARVIGENRVLVSIAPPISNLKATLNKNSGVLLRLRFRVAPQAQAGIIVPLDLSNVFALRPNGDSVGLILQQGTLTVVPFR
jgi:hypothetical protein